MNFIQIIFFCFAFLTVGSAVFILFTKNVIHAAFGLLLCLVSVAALFVFAGADFLAISQIVIYVGGILILILFGVMISKRMTNSATVTSENRRVKRAAFGTFILISILGYGIWKADFENLTRLQNQNTIAGSTLQTIGENLMTHFILPFEVSALLLMAALMGAVFIAGRLVKK